MATKLFLFTFVPVDQKNRIISGSESQTITVAARNYPSAIKEVLKLKLPNITEESDVLWQTVAEDYPEEDDATVDKESD